MDDTTTKPEVMTGKIIAPAVGLTSEIVAAFVSNNPVQVSELPTLIRSVFDALSGVSSHVAPIAEPEKLVPAVPIKKSVTPDYIVCLEDGKKLKMLKRHLNSTYGLTPDEYRTKWGLPPDYPMTAPNYAAQRSSLAKSIGLGQRPSAAAAEAPAKRPGRPKKSEA